MFEQELYNQEISEVHTEPGDLFHNYEIKNWNFSPRLYKILGASAIFNVLALIIIASSGVLTARGCDSPFVGRVCQVLDTVYIGSLIFGTDTEYADVDYSKTELEDADVTFLDVTGVTPPLSYPEGYFQLANPEQQFADVTDPMGGSGFIAPGIPYSNPTIGGSGLINTPAIKPRSNPKSVIGTPPASPFELSTDDNGNDNPTLPGNRKGRNRPQSNTTAATNTDTDTNPTVANSNSANQSVAAKGDEATQDKLGIFINKRPIRDRAKESLDKIESQAVKLDTPFSVAISGTLGLGKDGKTVVLQNPKPVVKNPPAKNDPVMEKFVQDWILAVGDTGWLGYLDKLKAKKVVISVEQTDTELVAKVTSDQPTENDAKLAASGIGSWLSIGKIGASGDDLTFLDNGSTTYEGKTFVLNFKLPKSIVQEMIMRKLAESKEKEAKPNGNAEMKPNDNTAKK
ncbi:MAG: hypothetical protein ABIO91_04395 [Pyrinomonadaceae bacterium]